MRVLVLGGYGGMGSVVARDLVKSGVSTIVAGRDVDKARKFCERLGKLAFPARIDVNDKNLVNEIKRVEADVVVNCTWYEYNMIVMPAVIEAGVHYVDLGGLYHKTLEQLKLNDKAREKSVTCILGCGSTPGTTNIAATYAAEKFDHIEKIEIRSGFRYLANFKKFVPPYSMKTIIGEFTQHPPVLREGKIKFLEPMKNKVSFSFPKPLGKVTGYFTIHSELATMPKTIDRGVKSMDFAVAFPKDFIDYVIGVIKKYRGDEDLMLEEFEKSTAKLDHIPQDIDAQRVEIWGKKDGRPLNVRIDVITKFQKSFGRSGGDVDTGVPASVMAQWLAKGNIKYRGVFPPEHKHFPAMEFFKEIGKRGIKVFEKVNKGKYKPLN